MKLKECYQPFTDSNNNCYLVKIRYRFFGLIRTEGKPICISTDLSAYKAEKSKLKSRLKELEVLISDEEVAIKSTIKKAKYEYEQFMRGRSRSLKGKESANLLEYPSLDYKSSSSEDGDSKKNKDVITESFGVGLETGKSSSSNNQRNRSGNNNNGKGNQQ